MVAGDLQLQAGARLLPIGPHKTGTATIQSALHLTHERLRNGCQMNTRSGSRDIQRPAKHANPGLLAAPPARCSCPECTLRSTGSGHSNMVVKYFSRCLESDRSAQTMCQESILTLCYSGVIWFRRAFGGKGSP
jgi:hypothetical protein